MRPWDAVLVLGISLVAAYEVRANIGYAYPTLTAYLRTWATQYPMLAVMVGALVGHLFWFNGGDPRGR